MSISASARLCISFFCISVRVSVFVSLCLVFSMFVYRGLDVSRCSCVEMSVCFFDWIYSVKKTETSFWQNEKNDRMSFIENYKSRHKTEFRDCCSLTDGGLLDWITSKIILLLELFFELQIYVFVSVTVMKVVFSFFIMNFTSYSYRDLHHFWFSIW